MVVRNGLIAATLGVVCLPVATLSGQQPDGAAWEDYRLEARIWLDRGSEPVLQRGERVRVYYRVSEDASVAIFHIDTDGTVRLVFPRSPRENHLVVGGRDYRVLFPETSYWFVDDDPGMGYFFVVASPEPLDLSSFAYSYYDGGWDLGRVGRQVYSDPYEAIDDYVAAMIPDWETAPYALDFSSYHVGETHDYPRFLCYDCHGFTPYYAWNPYHYACTSFRVVVYNDPFYYPSYRYGGAAVVYAPSTLTQPRYVFKERAEGEPGHPLLATRSGGAPSFREDGRARRGGEELRRRGDRLGPADRRSLPTVVPWPGGRRTPAPSRTPTTGRIRPPSNAAPLTRPQDGTRRRPVLEPRSRRRPSGEVRRPKSSGLDLPSGLLRLFRPGGDDRVRTGPARPSRPTGRAAPLRRPPGGSARPAPRRPGGGGAVRPSPRRPSGGSARPTTRRRRGGDG